MKKRHVKECRCNESLKTKAEEFTRLAYTGLLGGLEHLKIETRLLDEKIANTMGWTVFEHSSVTSILVRKLALKQHCIQSFISKENAGKASVGVAALRGASACKFRQERRELGRE